MPPPDINVIRRKFFERRAKIKLLRICLEEGKLIGVAMREAGIKSSDTLHQWKKKAKFNRLGVMIELARYRGQEFRDDQVEDAHYKRLIAGQASGNEYEFYLTNRRTDRWKKRNEFAPTDGGAPRITTPPVINYISVSVKSQEEAKVEVTTNGHAENGNGNGRMPHV